METVGKLGNEREPIEFAPGVRVKRVTRTGFGVRCECGRQLEAPSIGRLRYLYNEHRSQIHGEPRQ